MVKRADVAPVEDGFLQIDGNARINALTNSRCGKKVKINTWEIETASWESISSR